MNTLLLKAVLAFATIAIISLLKPNVALAAYPQVKISDSFYVQKDIKISVQKDPKIEVLKAYLEAQNSPMSDNARDFVEAAKKYDLDWKLVAAIAGLESSYGKHTPGSDSFETYNAWGWGVYGDQALGFGSYKNGIYTVSRGLRENYVNRGLTNPILMNRAYASSPTWGVRVIMIMQRIEDFEKNYAVNPSLNKEMIDVQTAGESAKPFKQTVFGTAA